jgi:lambda family phage portal protein
MFTRIKHLFKPHKPARRNLSVEARFDAAETNKHNVKHWAMADYRSADQEARPEVRRTLRQRSRYEIANNSYAKGIVQMLANDTIGTGPRLQILSNDEPWNNEVELGFADWCEAVKLSAKLRLMRIARCQDGESFAILSTNPQLPNEVTMDVRVIEADRVAGELHWVEDDRTVDGIGFDAYGNPLSYRVLKYHPGDTQYAVGDEAIIVPAEYMLHIFRADRPGLHRGIPELAAALPLFAQLRRYNLAVLSAAEAAADFAAILYTDAPPDGESESVEALDSISLERNMMLTVPAGWKMAQLDSKQPTATHGEFVKIILSEIARCVVSTYGTIAGDFSGHNYASGRLDNQLYHKSILVDRSFWESEVLNPIFSRWFREYALVHGIEQKIPRHTWYWDAFVHVDPAKEADAQAVRLANNVTTLAAECAKDGRDYMNVLAQRAKEIAIMKELGIPSGNPESAKENKNEIQYDE